MADLTPSSPLVWSTVNQKELTDPVLGGTDTSPANLACLNNYDRSNLNNKDITKIFTAMSPRPFSGVLGGPLAGSGADATPAAIIVGNPATTEYILQDDVYLSFAENIEEQSRKQDNDLGAIVDVNTLNTRNVIVKTGGVSPVTIPSGGAGDGDYYFVAARDLSTGGISLHAVPVADVTVHPEQPAAQPREQVWFNTSTGVCLFSITGGNFIFSAVIVANVEYEDSANIAPHNYDYNTQFYSAENVGDIKTSALANSMLVQGGYLPCDGSVYLRADYPALARIIGNYGTPPASPATEFRVPTTASEAFGGGTRYFYIKY